MEDRFEYLPETFNSMLWAAGTCAAAPQTKHCHDPATWQTWEALVAEHPDDMGIHALHALRIGLCVKVDRNELTIAQATTIFEEARVALREKKERQLLQKEGLLTL